MEQRISLITLGVSDLERAMAFYAALGWQGSSPDGEVDAALDEARAAGAAIPRAGAETFWGGYSGVFIDPEGHPWEVAHNPRWTIEEDGSVRLAP